MGGKNHNGVEDQNKVGLFFLASLGIWVLSACFEITFHRRTGLLSILAGFCFYQLANWALRLWIYGEPLFINTCVSLLHSSITSASVIFILANRWIGNGWSKMLDHSELVGRGWACAYPALCFSCGYFAYDQLDILQHRLYNSGSWIPAILAHHLLLLLCFTLALYRNVTINYLILTLICELHSIFLHLRKVRRRGGVGDARRRFAKAEWVLNWVTFVLARVTAHILITMKLIKDAGRFGNGVELPLALLGMGGMNLLNFFLGIDLLEAYRRDMGRLQNDRSD